MAKQTKKIESTFSPKPKKASVRLSEMTPTESPKPATPSPTALRSTTKAARTTRKQKKSSR